MSTLQKNWWLLKIVLTLIFLGIVYFNKQLLANGSLIIKADELIALSVTKKIQHHVKVVAWTYSGKIFLLDKSLRLIKKIEIPQVSISNIKEQMGSLYVLASKTSKTGEVESVVIQYDIAQGKEKKRWSDDKYYIWSLSEKNNKIVAMSSEGNLLELRPNGFYRIANYPENSHYISTNGSEPIICTAPNLSKLSRRTASCYREGRFSWKKDGRWRNVTPPFLCNNYLVEQHVGLGKDRGSISATNISTGKQVSEYMASDISALTCIQANVIYASQSSIIIRNLPDLKEMYVMYTNSNSIRSVIKIDNAIFFIDGERKIHKHTLHD